MNLKTLFLLLIIGASCTTQKFKKLNPINSEESIDQFLKATCLSSEGDVLLKYFNKEEPKVGYETFFDKNYKNWGLAISIPFAGEEDLHLNWRQAFKIEGTIGTKIKSSSFSRVLVRYQISRSEVLRALSFWADNIATIDRAKDPKDRINREKLISRIELVNNSYQISKEISENLKFSWTFKNLDKGYFNNQSVQLISLKHGKSIEFTFYVRECLK